jgi:hypothetical protein
MEPDGRSGRTFIAAHPYQPNPCHLPHTRGMNGSIPPDAGQPPGYQRAASSLVSRSDGSNAALAIWDDCPDTGPAYTYGLFYAGAEEGEPWPLGRSDNASTGPSSPKARRARCAPRDRASVRGEGAVLSDARRFAQAMGDRAQRYDNLVASPTYPRPGSGGTDIDGGWRAAVTSGHGDSGMIDGQLWGGRLNTCGD